MSNKVEDLKAKVLDAHTKADIASMYVLEQEANDLFDEDTLQGFYANILDLALENLTNTLESHRKMDINEVQDFATLRALYEYAIENYSANQLVDASALFEVLSGLSDDEKFSNALKFHHISASQELPLDDFLEKVADIDATQNAGTFYISCFQKEAQTLLDKLQTTTE